MKKKKYFGIHHSVLLIYCNMFIQNKILSARKMRWCFLLALVYERICSPEIALESFRYEIEPVAITVHLFSDPLIDIVITKKKTFSARTAIWFMSVCS